jgi:signal transduction histidine kinase
MTSIVEFLSEASTQEEADAFINMLKSSTKQLDETIHNLNEIITINENVSKPKEKKYLRREIENTLEILSGLIIKEDVEIVNRVSPDEHIYVIASYLDSILLNLISNAIKYRSPKRKPMIELSSYDEGNYKVLEVKDNGLGLDLKKYGSKVFGMYKTFHGNEDARGFGLYITKTQIEAMGGKITLASEPDKGSTFKVYFYDSGE